MAKKKSLKKLMELPPRKLISRQTDRGNYVTIAWYPRFPQGSAAPGYGHFTFDFWVPQAERKTSVAYQCFLDDIAIDFPIYLERLFPDEPKELCEILDALKEIDPLFDRTWPK